MEIVDENFGSRLERLRRSKNLRRFELASLIAERGLSLHSATIKSWELGNIRRGPKLKAALPILSEIFSCSENALAHGDSSDIVQRLIEALHLIQRVVDEINNNSIGELPRGSRSHR